MKIRLAVLLAVGLAASPALANKVLNNAVSNRDDLTSGEAGARAGTTLYNQLNPTKPLPDSRGNVVQDTIKNMGAGQSPGQAFGNAARSNAGLPPPAPAATPTPPAAPRPTPPPANMTPRATPAVAPTAPPPRPTNMTPRAPQPSPARPAMPSRR